MSPHLQPSPDWYSQELGRQLAEHEKVDIDRENRAIARDAATNQRVSDVAVALSGIKGWIVGACAVMSVLIPFLNEIVRAKLGH